MDLLSIAQGAVKVVDDWLKNHNHAKNEKKKKSQIKNHKLDLEDVIRKIDHDVPNASLTDLGHIRGFVVGKQGNLARRTLIPQDIRNEGNALYSASLVKIDSLREKFLNAA